MDKLILIDGNSLTYRAFYASAYSKAGIFKNSKGFPVNAILVWTRMLQKIINEYNPKFLFVAFDAGKKTTRHDLLPTYKAGRQKTPPELLQQLPIIKKMLDYMKIARFEKAKVEADDLIGSLAQKYQNELDIFIVTSDKDMLQLVKPNVTIILPQNGNKPNEIIDISIFKEKLGYSPEQVVDFKAIAGDSSDNLPGVNGIGAKGTIKLLKEYQNIKNIYQNINNLSESLQNKFIQSKEMVLLCKKIAKIDENIEIPLSKKDLLYSQIINDNFIDFLKEYELFSLIKYYQPKKNKKTQHFHNLIL